MPNNSTTTTGRVKTTRQSIITNTFFQMPRFLTAGEFAGNKMSNNARVLYTLLIDRHRLSVKNNWVDENGDVYVYFRREEMETQLGVSERTVTKIVQELKDFSLVEETKQGLNKPNKIYVLSPTIGNGTDPTPYLDPDPDNNPDEDNGEVFDDSDNDVSDNASNFSNDSGDALHGQHENYTSGGTEIISPHNYNDVRPRTRNISVPEPEMPPQTRNISVSEPVTSHQTLKNYAPTAENFTQPNFVKSASLDPQNLSPSNNKINNNKTNKNNMSNKEGIAATASFAGRAAEVPPPHCENGQEIPFLQIFEMYNALCEQRGLRPINKIEGTRKKQITARFKEHGFDGFVELFQRVHESDFLCGGGKLGWKADFNWLIDAENMGKVLEGKYGNEQNNVPLSQMVSVQNYPPQAERGYHDPFSNHAIAAYVAAKYAIAV